MGAEPLRGGMGANQRPHAAAVDRRNLTQIDQEIPRAAGEQRLDPLLELLGGPASDQRLLRGQDDAASDRVLGNRHVTGWPDYSM